MAVYLVAYDINVAPTYQHPPPPPPLAETTATNLRRTDFRNALISAYPKPHKLSESAYAIETSDTADEIADHLGAIVELWDEFYVTELVGPIAGQGPLHGASPTLSWLIRHLR
jgi:hypothetical protein